MSMPDAVMEWCQAGWGMGSLDLMIRGGGVW